MKWTFKPTIAIDTREQLPWEFHNLPSCVMTLKTGDYSVVGLVHRIMVERKSLNDLLGTIGQGRDPDGQFMRRLERIRSFRYRLLVVEASLSEIEQGEWSHSTLKPNHVTGNLLSWMLQHDLHVVFGHSAELSARLVERYLYQCAVREMKMPVHECEPLPPTVTIQWDFRAKVWSLLDSGREHDRWRDVTSCPFCQQELGNPELGGQRKAE